jgi:tRNA-2-methylthio-N6-dimethylallyladenosine synthase
MITYFFKTYGCQANVADSEGLSKFLNEMGCSSTTTEESADLIIVNTCAVREKAEQKLWSYLGQLSDIKLAKPFIRIGVIGCVASYKKKEIYTRFDQVNFVYGAREEMPALQAYLIDVVVQLETTKQLYGSTTDEKAKEQLRESVRGQDRDVGKVVELKNLLKAPRLSRNLPTFKKSKQEPVITLSPKQGEAKRAFINIMTGCNKYCTYCIVPFTRGREISYPMSEIVARVQHDVNNGAKEIMLIGQNVNSYVDPESGALFPELLRQCAQIPGIFWIRYISPHPQDMTIDLFDIMKQYRPKIAASLHFPLQSGSDVILKAMNRNYTFEEYLKKIAWIRERMPDATISTDLIVGFPGETDQDFEMTMHALETVRYDLIYSFIYSPRKYTKAWRMLDECPAEVKSARLEKLQARQMEIALEQNSKNIGKTLTCLVEKRLENGKLLARSEGNIRVLFDGNDSCVDKFVKLRIESTGPANMSAILVQD